MGNAINLQEPSQILSAQVKLRGSLDGSAVMWFMRGTQYGVIDLEHTPFYNLCNGSFQRITQIDEHLFQIKMCVSLIVHK